MYEWIEVVTYLYYLKNDIWSLYIDVFHGNRQDIYLENIVLSTYFPVLVEILQRLWI